MKLARQVDDATRAALHAVGNGMSGEQVRQAEKQADEWMRKNRNILK